MNATTQRRQAGQTTPEYLGLLVVVAGILFALTLGSPGRLIASGIRAALCRIVQEQQCGTATPSEPPPVAPLDAIQLREKAAHEALEHKIAEVAADPHHDAKE